MLKKILPWGLSIVPAFVFLQSLPFKFTGHPMTQHIFRTIGSWFASLGLAPLDAFFTNVGAYVIGSAEALAAIALLIPATRHWGALLGTALLSGAIFFHVATPLGIAVQFPGEATADSSLFSASRDRGSLLPNASAHERGPLSWRVSTRSPAAAPISPQRTAG